VTFDTVGKESAEDWKVQSLSFQPAGSRWRIVRPEYLLTACGYRLSNRGFRNSYREN
jgi:hypothetical protein